MNAYELADELNRKLTGRLIGFTAAKLRQQADRIAELEKQIEHAHGIGEAGGFIKGHQAQENRITELEAEVKELHKIAQVMAIKESDSRKSLQNYKDYELNAEPVAWWCGKKDDESEDFIYPETRQKFIDHPLAKNHLLFPIPLYTTPQTKPLSDEEIDDMADEILGIQSTEDISYIREFARAIEAKVRGEK